jgi:hypothetical protein
MPVETSYLRYTKVFEINKERHTNRFYDNKLIEKATTVAQESDRKECLIS